MDAEQVTGYAAERLGMEIQATTLLRAQPAGGRAPEVWEVMTEHGWFWLVESNGEVELLRATDEGFRAPVVAEHQFLELHPERRLGPAAPGRPPGSLVFDCRRCGCPVTRQRRTEQLAHQLCRRCAHVARLRERYHDDPEYRARLLAAAARSRRPRAGDGV
jgi:hypothetical protein